jgi:hypothetical protein
MKRVVLRIAVPMGVYLVLEWLFAYASQTEGLFSPKGLPNIDVVGLGAAYMAVRLFVHATVPVLLGLALAKCSPASRLSDR